MKRICFFLLIFCALITSPVFCRADNSASLLSSGRAIVAPGAKTTLPFKLVGHLIIVQASVDGSAPNCTFVLDTGSITALTSRFAARLGLPMEGQCRARGVTGAADQVCLTRLKSLSLGGFKAQDVSAVVFDPHFRQRAGIRIDGFIGSNFLRFFKVEIDYHRKLLTLSDGATPLAAVPGGVIVPIGLDWQSAFVPQIATRCGNTAFTAGVDTGLYDSVSIPGAFLDRANTDAQLVGTGAMGSGNFGNMDKARLVRLNNLDIGSLRVGKVVATTQSGQKYALIGYGLLSHFAVTIDYPARKMLLVPAPEAKPLDNLYSTGLAVGRDSAGKTFVSGVWKPSPAANMGLAPGERIITVDGRPADAYTLQCLQKLLFDDAIPDVVLSVREPFGEKNLTIGKKCLF